MQVCNPIILQIIFRLLFAQAGKIYGRNESPLVIIFKTPTVHWRGRPTKTIQYILNSILCIQQEVRKYCKSVIFGLKKARKLCTVLLRFYKSIFSAVEIV
jgi:hypothetical protein